MKKYNKDKIPKSKDYGAEIVKKQKLDVCPELDTCPECGGPVKGHDNLYCSASDVDWGPPPGLGCDDF